MSYAIITLVIVLAICLRVIWRQSYKASPEQDEAIRKALMINPIIEKPRVKNTRLLAKLCKLNPWSKS